MKQLLDCEMAYYQCFSESEESDATIRFVDEKLLDMYDHNYTYVKEKLEEKRLEAIINEEVNRSKREEKTFCKFDLPYMPNEIHEVDGIAPEVSRLGIYEFLSEDTSHLNGNDECVMKQIVNEEVLDDLVFLDLIHDRERLGEDFCKRRAYRRGRVYLKEGGVDSYICYHEGRPVGNVDLFIYNGMAKIEDFAVIPSEQRKGYGTAMIKYLIDLAKSKGVKRIYLVTDEEDTAKEMYRKLGFEKLGEKVEIFYYL